MSLQMNKSHMSVVSNEQVANQQVLNEGFSIVCTPCQVVGNKSNCNLVNFVANYNCRRTKNFNYNHTKICN